MERVIVGSLGIVERQFLRFVVGHVHATVCAITHISMVVTNTGDKGNILADVKLAHDVCGRKPFVSVVILLNFSCENWAIHIRINIVEVLHHILIQRKGEVKIVITIVQEGVMFKTPIHEVCDANIAIVIFRARDVGHIVVNKRGVLVQSSIVSVG